MSHFDRVSSRFGELPYMRHQDAAFMRDFMIEHHARDILEIGFYHGKSSAYFAAILQDLGRGHLVTIDRDSARQRDPNIEQVLSALDLSDRVTPMYAERSYTWEMAKLIRARPRPQYDLCYFDGGHTWDVTGFGFVLVDMLLRPGGWIVFDDLEWTIERAMRVVTKIPMHWRTSSPDERTTPAVKLVFDLLVPHLGYTDARIINSGRWGVARKPVEESRHRASVGGPLRHLLNSLPRRQGRSSR